MTEAEKSEFLDEMADVLGIETEAQEAYGARVHALNGAMQVEHENGWQAVLTAARAFHGFLIGDEVVANVTPIRVQIAPDAAA